MWLTLVHCGWTCFRLCLLLMWWVPASRCLSSHWFTPR